jgi:ERF superfamily
MPPKSTTTPPSELVESPGALMQLNAQSLISQALSSNAAIETIEKLVSLAKDVRAVQAREAWHRAMADFQKLCPPIQKTKTATITTRAGGRYSYSYAPLEEILRVVRPVMAPLGLSISWRSGKVDGTSVSVICQVSHTLTHSEDSGVVVVPIAAGDDGRGANPSQRVASALTYAKRYSLLGILGLAPEEDDDAAGASGDEDDRTPPATEPGPESSRTGVVESVSRAADREKLSVEERLDLTARYLKGQPLNKAALEDLRQLQMFLGDAEGVAQWRADRERDVERGKP